MNARWWLGCGLLWGLVGCQGDSLPRVRYGEEACAHCRMIINDERFAAALTEPSGETFKFDDVGCLVAFLKTDPHAGAHRWIRGYQSADWLDAEQAYFVYGPQLQTPMASGVAAVTSPQAADALAQEWQGKTLRFTELAGFLQSKPDADQADTSAAVTNPIPTQEESR